MNILNLFSSSIGDDVIKALASIGLWTALLKTIIIIGIGFGLTKAKILPEKTSKVLTKIVMVVGLPCLAFCSFMTSITLDEFKTSLFAFLWSFIMYGILIGLSKLIFLPIKNPTRKKVFEMMFIFGSTTFFGQPLISAVYPSATAVSQILNIAYRVFLYSYAYYMICVDNRDLLPRNPDGKIDSSVLNVATANQTSKMGAGAILKKIFLNPIIIATLAGFILWALQLAVPANSKIIVDIGQGAAPFWNIKYSATPLYNTLNTIGGLASPLVWIAIGCTLGKSSFKDAVKDKQVWIYSFLKVLVPTFLNLGLLACIKFIPTIGNYVTFNVIAASTLMWATPTATVVIGYCIDKNKDAAFASSCSLISTLISVVFIPINVVLLTVIQATHFFVA